jgi:hypothetical protein
MKRYKITAVLLAALFVVLTVALFAAAGCP